MFYMNSVANNIFIPDVTTVEVRSVILLKKNSSACWDEIFNFFLRRRSIEINKQYIQDSRKERHKEHSEKN